METCIKKDIISRFFTVTFPFQFVFEGLWSNITHPKDFPFSLWLTHFSDIIGGSHGPNFTVWREGGIATNALRQLAEWGSVRALEQELRLKVRFINNILTLLWQQLS